MLKTESSFQKIKKIKMISNFYADFEVLKQIGKGSFGKVMMCKDRKTGLVAAVKVLGKLKKSPYIRQLFA
jgi:serine/threonine protein kinase